MLETLLDLAQNVVLWTVIIAGAAALVGGYFYPPTKPYVQKYGIPVGIILLVLLGYVLLRRRPGRKIDQGIEAGRELAQDNLTALDKVVERAEEERIRGELALVERRTASEAARQEVRSELRAINLIDDSVERRRALIKLRNSRR